MTIPTSSNLLRITLEGIAPPEGEPDAPCPGSPTALTDGQVKDLAAYIRSEFGRAPAWPDVERGAQEDSRGEEMISLDVNGKTQELDADPATPLLYVLRDHLQLNGAKFGCGLGQCGACTVLVDGGRCSRA
jgi:hypothetical protein